MIYFWIFLWYISGVSSFVYWWTKEFDYKTTNIPISLFIGLCGPLAFIMGCSVHGKESRKQPKVLIKKRK